MKVGDFVRYVGDDRKYHYREIVKIAGPSAAIIEGWDLGPPIPDPKGGTTQTMTPKYRWEMKHRLEIVDRNQWHTDTPVDFT